MVLLGSYGDLVLGGGGVQEFGCQSLDVQVRVEPGLPGRVGIMLLDEMVVSLHARGDLHIEIDVRT